MSEAFPRLLYSTLHHSHKGFNSKRGANQGAIIRPRCIDHSLKVCVLNLRYARIRPAKNAKGASFPMYMYGVFYLTTFSSTHDSKF